MSASVGVGRAHNPRGRVRNTQVQHLPLLHQDMQAVHNLLDRGSVVPPVEIQDINEIRLQLPQRIPLCILRLWLPQWLGALL